MHVFQAEDDLCRVEAHLVLAEDAILWEVVVEVTPVHEVKDETELLRSLKCIRHADDKGGSVLLKQNSKNKNIITNLH